MPPYYTEQYQTESLGEDETTIHNYPLKLSERDVDALQRLKDRNGAGMTVGGRLENIAVWKMINQICEINTEKEEQKEWACRYCGKSTFETEQDYLVDQTAHLGCFLEAEK